MVRRNSKKSDDQPGDIAPRPHVLKLLTCIGLIFVLPLFGVVLPLVLYDESQIPGAYSTFLSGDLENPSTFAAKLKAHRDPVSTYIYDHLREPSRQSLAKWPGSGGVPVALQRSMIQDLNAIILGPSLWDEARFARVTIRQESRDLAQSAPPGLGQAHLNRLLLEDAYPLELSRKRGDPKFSLMISIDAWLVLAAALYGMRAGVALWQVEAEAVRKARQLLVLRFIYTLAFTAALLNKFPREAWDWFLHGAGRFIFTTGVAHLLWYPYLRFSKRVKATYRET